jgi:hypothetical protein
MALGTITIPKMPHTTAAFRIDGNRVSSADHAAMFNRRSRSGIGVSCQPRFPNIECRRFGKYRRESANVRDRLYIVSEPTTVLAEAKARCVATQSIPMIMPGATAHKRRTASSRRIIKGAKAIADTVRPVTHKKPRGLAVDRPRLARTSMRVVVLDQLPDPIGRGLHAVSERAAANTRAQTISHPLGLTTMPKKTAMGVDTSSRKLPHQGFRRRM